MPSDVLAQVQRHLPPSPHLAADDDPGLLRFTEDLGMDSLDFVELVFSMENHCRIRIPDSELKEVHTVRDLVVCLERNLQVNRLSFTSLFQ